MNLSLHLLAGILKKAVIVFGAVLIVTGFLFLLSECRLRGLYGSFPLISGMGTVRFLEIEGGFWGIIGDDGGKYDIYLIDSFFPDGFQVNGLRVQFSGYRHSSGSPIHMWGVWITLIDIRKL